MRKIILVIVIGLFCNVARAQLAPADTTLDFCTAISKIYEAAKEKPSMQSIRGNIIDTNGIVKFWRTNLRIPVPGADTAKVIQVMYEGTYECYLLSSAKKFDLVDAYDKYLHLIDNCMKTKGVPGKLYDNDDNELNGYDKAVYQMPESEDYKKQRHTWAEPGRPKVILEVNHNTREDKFEIVLTIRQ